PPAPPPPPLSLHDALPISTHRRTPLKGLLVASPANPTGTMMTAAALGMLIEAAEREDIPFISDEIYHGLDYAFPAETALRLSDGDRKSTRLNSSHLVISYA